MKIRILKQEVLDTLKNNLDSYIKFYYQRSDNDWLYSICDCEPFEEFKIISDFELADLNQQLSKTDFDNCKKIYLNFSFLTESQACDERLWAGLAHDVFYQYLRKRFKMAPDYILNSKNPVGEVRTRFFYNGGLNSGKFRNALAKCWWVGHHTWSNETKNFDLLDKLGYRDMSTKVTDIFHNYTFINNHDILSGIIDGLYYFNNNNIFYDMKKHVRPTLQYLNAIGGGIVLDSLSSNEIREIVIEQIQNKLNGQEDVLIDEFNENSNDFEEKTKIEIGDEFKIKYLSGEKKDEESNFYKVIYNKDFILSKIAQEAIGKTYGDTITIDNNIEGEIIEIIKAETNEE